MKNITANTTIEQLSETLLRGQEQLTEVVLLGQKQQTRAQEQQTRAQAELTRQVMEETLENARFRQTVLAELTHVKTKLNQIEENTVTILEVMVQDFDGINPETKQELEEAAAVLEKNKVEINDFVLAVKSGEKVARPKDGKLVRPSTLNYFNGRQNTVTVKDAVANLNMESTAKLIPLGNYVSSILVKIFGIKFGGYYPIYFAPLIETLIKYHAEERVSVRQY